jgi:hypothetical protein
VESSKVRKIDPLLDLGSVVIADGFTSL